MIDGENRSAIDQATAWYVKRDAGSLSPSDETAFRQWLARPANRAAFDEIVATWADLGRIERPDMSESQQPEVGAFAWLRSRRALAAAAAILALIGAGYGFGLSTRLQADAYTATGEIRTVTLDDGSTVALNTASAIAIDYSSARRRVRLLEGEAVFTVAKDAGRPFVVAAAGGETRALGTVFSVREQGRGATVMVIESRVRVATPTENSQAVELSSGEAVDYSSERIGEIRAVDADGETAWRRGKLIFVDRPLGAVVADLNRYHAGRIQIMDSSIGKQLVSGVFDARDPVRVLDALEGSLGLHSTRLTNYLILLHR